MRETASLFWQLIKSPRAFFKRLEKPSPAIWRFCLGIYGASIIAASIFYTWKPEGFPKDGFSAEVGSHSILFWLAMGAAGAGLTVLVGAMIWLLLRFLEGKFKITLPQTLLVLFASHVWYLILFAVLAAACILMSAELYKIAEFIFSLAGFIFTIAGIKTLGRSTAPRVFVCLLVSSLGIVCLLFGLYLAEILPGDILKVLLFV
ncbi:MAG: hypothetical protein HYT79_11160 [Elusimicrobia bacterium]|nr:hypothetical protein [Elusimicrobiota bacterium]